MKKIEKGEYGYVHSQKKKRILITSIMFLIPLMIFFTGLIITKTRLNLFTFVAIMGCLPASRSAVGMVMMILQKPVEENVYREFQSHAGELETACELCISAYEKNTTLDFVAVSAGQVVAYSSSPKTDPTFAEKHIKDILKGNRQKVNVKIFTDWKPFISRIDDLREKTAQTEEEKEICETIKRVLLAISI